jgi:hypothetical protein
LALTIIIEHHLESISTLYEALRMNDFYRDILTGLLFIAGLLGYAYGELVISSALFAIATIASNVNQNRKRGKAGQFSWD